VTQLTGLRVTHARVSFGAKVGLDDVMLCAARGERVALLGPSGVGKTSLLRAIAGLGGLVAGTVTVDGRDVTAAPPERRGVVYMHQAPSLFPHLSVLDNVAFPLEVRGVSRGDARTRARDLLDRVQLGSLAMRPSTTLSGGQRHRAALARALAADPSVLLLDEPFSSLDPELRADVRTAVIELLAERTGPAIVLVTHDVDDAAGLADRLVVLLDGRIAQDAPPSDLLAAPQSLAVARFLGLTNLIRGSRGANGVVTCVLGGIDSAGAVGPVTVTLRAGSVYARVPAGDGPRGTVVSVLERVAGTTMRVNVGGEELLAVPDRGVDLASGSCVELYVDRASAHVIDEAIES
jgi:putative spermidine/putrescine transport system ATP-binding protein